MSQKPVQTIVYPPSGPRDPRKRPFPITLFDLDDNPIDLNGVGLPDAGSAEGLVRVSDGADGAKWIDALDRLPIPAYGASDFICGAPFPSLFGASGVPGATNRLNLTRVIAPRSGQIRNLYFPEQAVPASGAFEAGIYDVNGFRLWTTGAQVAATYFSATAPSWKKLGDPRIDVDSGEPLFFAWVNPENTVSSYRQAAGSSIAMDLPADLLPDGNGKYAAYLPGQTTLPAFIDPNSFIASTLIWAMVGKVLG